VNSTGLFGHLMFCGPQRELKIYLRNGELAGHKSGLLHLLECHDVGINDGLLSDPYGSKCKCPPGDYAVGTPMPCATRNPDGSVTQHNADDRAYGCWFIPLADTEPDEAFAKHGRAGIGIHGGGSDLQDSFAPHQGWEYTLGCLRLQNQDLEHVLVPFINFVHSHGGAVKLSVVWDD
jgi:hypothetical protein